MMLPWTVLRLMEVSRDGWMLLLSLFLGQLASFTMAVTSFTTSFITSLGADAPLTQSLISYMLLALVYGTIFLYRRQKLTIPWNWYLALVFIDVQGSFLAIKAYNYTYITSINLLDCCTIPLVMILTRFALGTRYSFWQFIGAGTCMAGLALVLFSDSNSPDVQDRRKHPLLGDALIITSTLFAAVSDVGQEYCIKKKDRIELVAMLGIFGVLITGIEISVFERKNLEKINWSPMMIGLFVGFAAAAFVYYTISSFVLKMSGATMFNLSLLTTDVWAVVIRISFYHQQINWFYYIAFAVVAIGLIIYSVNETSYDETAASTTETAAQYNELANEEII